MTSFFSQLKMTLFGSQKRSFFRPTLSLHENFNAMCRLNICKVRSSETQVLAGILSNCKLNSTRTARDFLTYEERRKDIVVLELAKLALYDWQQKRSSKSTRVQPIKQLIYEVENMQNRLVRIDQIETLKITPPKGYLSSWRHPLYDVKVIKASLSSSQHTIFWHLKAAREKFLNKIEVTKQNKVSKFYCAVSIPVLNYLFEWDLFWDAFNTCFELAQII